MSSKAGLVPKPKGKSEEATRHAAGELRQLLARRLAERMPAWTVQSTPRGQWPDGMPR